MGGEVIGVVSQGQKAANAAKKRFELDFEMVSDPQCEIAKKLYDQGILEIFLDGEFPKQMVEIMGVSDISEVPGGGYQLAMQQPAVCAFSQDLTPFFLWASIPSAANWGGALGRPNAQEVFEACRRGINGDLSEVRWEPKNLLPVPLRGLLVLIILANGNFVKFRGISKDRIPLSVAKLVATLGAGSAYAYLQRKRPALVLTPMVAYCSYLYQVQGDVLKALVRPGGSSIEEGLLRKNSKL